MSTPDNLGSELLQSAARLSRWASRHASFDVPVAQARLLALVDELGPARTTTLAAADHSSQPTTTAQVRRLEAAGWVSRDPDPGDARASVISLTETGRSALETARQARLAVLAPALDRLDRAGRDRLRIAVDVIDAILEFAGDPLPQDYSHRRKDG